MFSSVFLKSKDKDTLWFLSDYFKEIGQGEISFDFVYKYFSGYSKSQVKRILSGTNVSKKYRVSLRKTSVIYRKYLIYIMLSYKYGERSKKEVEVLKKFIRYLHPPSNLLQQVDYYIFSYKKNKTLKRNQLKIWEQYSTLGLFPKTSFLILKERAQKHSKNLGNLKDFQDANDQGRRKRQYLFFIKNVIGLSIFSIVFIFTNNAYFYFGHLVFLFYIEMASLKYDEEPKGKYKQRTKNNNFMFTGLERLLLIELTAHFLYDRYNVNETNISKYLKSFIKLPYRHELNEIVKENKNLNDICYQIFNSGYKKNRFVKHLFDIAAADNIFSDKEDEYIYKVAKLLNVPRETVTKIRNQYLRRGVKEKKVEQKTYNNNTSSSSSMYSFYSSKAYKILGIEKSASADEIKKAYRTLVMKHHPDKFATQSKEVVEKAEEKFQILTEAYELVKRLRNIK